MTSSYRPFSYHPELKPPHPSYSTAFPVTENPISEGGIWLPSGSSWAKMKSTGGFAVGTQAGGGGTYDDSHAVLAGTWGPNVHITGVIHRDPSLNTTASRELWFGVRWQEGANSARGFECNVSCGDAAGGSYAEVVRWAGGYGLWNYVSSQGEAGPGVVASGDIFEVYIVGNIITRYFTPFSTGVRAKLTSGGGGTGNIDITNPNGFGPGDNGAPWTDGNPSIGHFRNGNAGAFDGDYCWDSFSVVTL